MDSPEKAGSITFWSPSLSSCLCPQGVETCTVGQQEGTLGLSAWSAQPRPRLGSIQPPLEKYLLARSGRLFGVWSKRPRVGRKQDTVGRVGVRFLEPLGRGPCWWHHNPGYEGDFPVTRRTGLGRPGNVSRGFFWLPATNPQIKQLNCI